MSQSLDSFNPFGNHPFTSGGQSGPTAIPRPPPTSSPYNQALQYQKQSSSPFMPQPMRRGDPSTPPGGYTPPAPGTYFQQPPSQAVFTSYKADGRRTPDLSDILVKKSAGGQWSRQ